MPDDCSDLLDAAGGDGVIVLDAMRTANYEGAPIDAYIYPEARLRYTPRTDLDWTLCVGLTRDQARTLLSTNKAIWIGTEVDRPD